MQDTHDRMHPDQLFTLERLEAYAVRFGLNSLTRSERKTMTTLRRQLRTYHDERK